ncbi:CoA ester lyase [Variovorax sp. J22G21]|uniref:HpcH/HpaI aldolase/citrate lyase family protein n=1 Tax=Variovorax fucosicus TaxID=3053517 RepID=UPI0025749FF7|nr:MULTISPECIES: CoA ester lyase [unclassified Variovorax]MDM0037726.1 CoA ester lyase [Variovorax sp. J22R193]MDM0062502.1 CoA ester lyase [Variovorax sp. J22G21]
MHTASALALARTFLFVPADRPERYVRALGTGAGAVIIDLEDAVAPDKKASARALLEEGFLALPEIDRARLLVRVNAAGTPWHDEDKALAARLALAGLPGLVAPKAEDPRDLAGLAEALGPTGVLVPLIESAAGWASLDAIAAAPQVLRLAFGHLDFQADLGLACDADEVELVSVRLAIVLASRRAGLAAPVDGVTADWRDAARLESDARRARRGGFGGKLCIHPEQVAPAHRALGPSVEELAWAHRVIGAAQAARGSVISLDGRMVDLPVVKLAERLLSLDAQGQL